MYFISFYISYNIYVLYKINLFKIRTNTNDQIFINRVKKFIFLQKIREENFFYQIKWSDQLLNFNFQ